jgi:tetratricopeptide (TPR) repeat protein
LGWIQSGLALLPEDAKWIRVRAKALRCAATHSTLIDNNHDGGVFSRQSERLYRQCDDPIGLAYALISVVYFNVLLEPEHPLRVSEPERMAFLKEAETIVREAGDETGLYILFEATLYMVEDPQYAITEDQIAELRRMTQGTIVEGIEHYYWALLAQRQDDLPRSLAHYQKMVEIAHRSGIKTIVVWNLFNMGHVALELGDINLAKACFHDVLAPALEAGCSQAFAGAMYQLNKILLDQGQTQEVGKNLMMGLAMAPGMEHHVFLGYYLLALVEAAEKLVRPTGIPRLLGYVEKHRADLRRWQRGCQEYERIKAAVQSHMGEAAFQAGYQAGQAMTRQQALAEARLLAEEISKYPYCASS